MLPETLYWLMRELIEKEGMSVSEEADDVLAKAAQVVVKTAAEKE